MTATIPKLVLARVVKFWTKGRRIKMQYHANGRYCALGAIAKSYEEITGVHIFEELIVKSPELQPIINFLGYRDAKEVYADNDSNGPSVVYKKMVKALEKD